LPDPAGRSQRAFEARLDHVGDRVMNGLMADMTETTFMTDGVL